MTTPEAIDKIDRERRRREKELLILLLLLTGQTRLYAIRALRLGHDPLAAMQTVWLGNAHFRGVVKPIARAMAEAHANAFQRTAKMIDVDPASIDQVALRIAMEQPAGIAANQMLDTMRYHVGGSGVFELPAPEQAAALRQVFEDAGYTAENPTALERAAEAQIVQADASGVAEAANDPTANHSGYRHHSILDKGTTKICNERDGLTLPKDDPYWQRNWPRLHFGCRSIVLPYFGDGPWSKVYPTTPPAPGFGIMPLFHYSKLSAA